MNQKMQALATLTIVVGFTLSGCEAIPPRQEADLCQTISEARTHVFERVSKSSLSDLRIVLASFECLDGGDLEDAYISVGEGLFKSPSRFVPILISRRVTAHDLASIATMLLAVFVDEPCKSESELTRRKGLIVREGVFLPLRSSLLPAIDDSLARQTKWCRATRGTM